MHGGPVYVIRIHREARGQRPGGVEGSIMSLAVADGFGDVEFFVLALLGTASWCGGVVEACGSLLQPLIAAQLWVKVHSSMLRVEVTVRPEMR